MRKAREAIKAAWSDGNANAAMDKASEALAAIDKAIGMSELEAKNGGKRKNEKFNAGRSNEMDTRKQKITRL